MKLDKAVIDTMHRTLRDAVIDFSTDIRAMRTVSCPNSDLAVIMIKHPLAPVLAEWARRNLNVFLSQMHGEAEVTIQPAAVHEDPQPPTRN